MAKVSARGRTLIAEWVDEHDSKCKTLHIQSTYRLMSDGKVLNRFRCRKVEDTVWPTAGWRVNILFSHRELAWLEQRFANLKRTV